MTVKPASSCTNEYETNQFYNTLPRKPYCADNYEDGITIRRRDYAVRYPHIQPNEPWIRHHIIIDCDYTIANQTTLAFVWEERNLPEPTYATITPGTGTAHLIYLLDEPVYKNNKKQFQFYQDVNDILIELFNADPNYNYVYTKNPLHPRWKTITTDQTYTLAELKAYAPTKPKADVIPFGKYTRRTRDEANAALGRNCRMFEDTRILAYQVVNSHDDFDTFHAAVREIADNHNEGRLHPPEVRSTVKSIARWTWDNKARLAKNLRVQSGEKCTPEETRTRQSRAALRTAVLKQAKTMAAIELAIKSSTDTPTVADLAALTGKSVTTIKRHLPRIKALLEPVPPEPPPREVTPAPSAGVIRSVYQDSSRPTPGFEPKGVRASDTLATEPVESASARKPPVGRVRADGVKRLHRFAPDRRSRPASERRRWRFLRDLPDDS